MNTSSTRRPETSEHSEYFGRYIGLVPDGDVVSQLNDQIAVFRSQLDAISEADANVVHAPYTWTIKQVVGHMIDAERVFGYRALRFASNDLRPIPGMDQDDWVANTDYESPSLSALVDELEFSRHANLSFYKRLTPESWDRQAAADGNEMSVRALAYCLVGHITHHLEIVKKRVA